LNDKLSGRKTQVSALRRKLALSAGLSLLGLSACSRENPGAPPKAAATAGNVGSSVRADNAPDFEVSGILLPGLVDSASSGSFVELVSAIDMAYPEGRIVIKAFPRARAIANVVVGISDFAFPIMRLGPAAEAKLPFRFSTESVGRVSFVLYSHVRLRLTKKKLLERAGRGLPYVVLAPDADWGVPTQPMFDFVSAFKMIDAGRIDGLLWAQEEADRMLRDLDLKTIHREHFQDYDDVFVMPRTTRGNFVDQVLNRVIRNMRASGVLATLYEKVHRPYLNWQPPTR
jgi:polar amino acid transport system substrate-binding protein